MSYRRRCTEFATPSPALIGARLRLSLPGLTRQSIFFAMSLLAKKMDARVKPAHDDLCRTLNLAPMTPTLPRKRGRERTECVA